MLEEYYLQFDRMLRQVGEGVVEQAVAVMVHDAVDVSLIGRDDPERRAKILPCQGEPGRRIVGRAGTALRRTASPGRSAGAAERAHHRRRASRRLARRGGCWCRRATGAR